RVLPYPLSEYSTFGGTTSNTLRDTTPSRSSSRSCCVNILRVMPGISRCNSPGRRTPRLRCQRMTVFHLPPITIKVASTGQFGLWVLVTKKLQSYKIVTACRDHDYGANVSAIGETDYPYEFKVSGQCVHHREVINW